MPPTALTRGHMIAHGVSKHQHPKAKKRKLAVQAGKKKIISTMCLAGRCTRQVVAHAMPPSHTGAHAAHREPLSAASCRLVVQQQRLAWKEGSGSIIRRFDQHLGLTLGVYMCGCTCRRKRHGVCARLCASVCACHGVGGSLRLWSSAWET